LGGSGLVITQIQTVYFLNTNIKPYNYTNPHTDFDYALGDRITVKMMMMTRTGDPKHPQKLFFYLR
jgi:hypothetical protein